MLELNGKHTNAIVFANTIEETAVGQIIEYCNSPAAEGCQVRIMPDVHAGKGCVIGLVATTNGKIVPSTVGVDIGCGVSVYHIDHTEPINFDRLDKVIRNSVPSGNSVHQKQRYPFPEIENLRCRDKINKDRAYKSVGTLGGGNHFIEMSHSEDEPVLMIHSGSRYLGKQIAEHYQQLAVETCGNRNDELDKMISVMKAEGRQADIQQATAAFKQEHRVTKGLEYLTGQLAEDYLHDLQIAQRYAAANRAAIAKSIAVGMRFDIVPICDTIHNYVDDKGVLRKGAVSAALGEMLIVPMNMRDGSLLCIGKGSDEWLHSAPHGAGRIMSRGAAKAAVTLEEFQKSMEGVWSTSVKQETIDESPMAYKPMDEIVSCIGETVNIVSTLKPCYNFKAN